MTNHIMILLLSHLITDFVLQTDSLVNIKHGTKKTEKHRALFIHSAIFYVISIMLFAVFSKLSSSILLGLLILSISHYILDWIKSALKSRFSDLKLFIADQTVHLIFIIGYMLYFYNTGLRAKAIVLVRALTGELKLSLFFTPTEKLLFIVCVLILITSFANVLIRFLLYAIKIKINIDNNEKEVMKIGRYIGAVERMLTVLGVIAGSYEALAALYASKTAIRFGQARDNPEFAEYFILGTSISALIGIVTGLLAKSVLGL